MPATQIDPATARSMLARRRMAAMPNIQPGWPSGQQMTTTTTADAPAVDEMPDWQVAVLVALGVAAVAGGGWYLYTHVL